MAGRTVLNRLTVVIILLVLAGGMIGLVLFLRLQGLERSTKWLSVFGGLLALAAVAVPPTHKAIAWLLRGSRQEPLPMDEAAEMLAEALALEWTREERLRQAGNPALLPVRWEATPASEAAMAGVDWEEVVSDGAAGPRSLAGEYDTIHEGFTRQLSHRRLVVLGRGGGGKTFLVQRLARDLLRHRSPGDRVPVVLPLASWDPKQSIHEWVAHRLVRNHPLLQTPTEVPLAGKYVPLATALADAERLLLILDGFDEVPERSRKKALACLNGLGADIPLVLTSRPDEYQRAVLDFGRGLARAAVVELAPLGPTEIKAYLERTTAVVPPGRWDEVFSLLDQGEGNAIAQALQTPLMIWLAHVVYEDSGSVPAELADPTAFADRVAVEQHLLDTLVGAAYADHGRRWSPEQARRWLGFLAQWLQCSRPEDLAWWQLRAAAPGTAAALATGLPVGCALGLTAGSGTAVLGGPVLGLLVGAVCLVIGTVRAFSLPVVRFEWWLPRRMLGRAIGMASGFGVGFPYVFQGEFATGVANGTAAGLFCGLVAAFFVHEPRSAPSRVTLRMRGTSGRFMRRTAVGLLLGTVYGAVLGASLGILEGPTTGIIFSLLPVAMGLLLGVIDGLKLWIDTPADVTRATSPRTVLSDDRVASFLRALVVGLFVTVATLLTTAPAYGPATAAGLACAVGLAFALTDRMAGVVSTAWGRFVLVRAWLALRRKLPWRLMAFLADAHERGVLRQSGAVHQFRHARLQRRLAAARP